MQNSKKTTKRPRRRGDSSVVLMTALSLILLAFFILLYTISSPNKDKQQNLAFEIKKAFTSLGGIFNTETFQEAGRGFQEDSLEISSEVESLLSEIQGYMESNEELQNFSYEISHEATLINLPSDFVFKAKSAELSAKAKEQLEPVYELIVRVNNSVRIEGHTDNLPNQEGSISENWRLSAERAQAVMEYFVNRGEVATTRFSVAGYGSEYPVANNRFSKGRAQNRRVVVVILGALERVGEEFAR